MIMLEAKRELKRALGPGVVKQGLTWSSARTEADYIDQSQPPDSLLLVR
jgi:hypothetical protein